MPIVVATRSFGWWLANPIERLAPSCVALGSVSGGAWHLAPAKTLDTSGLAGVGAERIVLCESAIDAISCFQLNSTPNSKCICISTAGVRPNAPWLAPLIARGYDIYCGFDDDDPGNVASREIIRRHPSIKRLRPPVHDWNDALLQAQ